MTKSKKIFWFVTALAGVIVLVAPVVLWLNQPNIMRYRASYWDRALVVGGYGSGWFEASYGSVGVGIRSAETWYQRQGRPFDMAIHLDGTRIPIQSLDRDQVVRFGGEMGSSYRGHVAYDVWVISGDKNRLHISLSPGGELRSVRLIDGPGNYASGWRQIQMSWDGKEPFDLPIPHPFLVEYFGKPTRYETYRSFGP